MEVRRKRIVSSFISETSLSYSAAEDIADAERRTGKVRRSKTNFLPLCHASNRQSSSQRDSHQRQTVRTGIMVSSTSCADDWPVCDTNN